MALMSRSLDGGMKMPTSCCVCITAGSIRKNGFCATEVFHLWHQEANRNNASQNAQIVKERVKTGVTRSTLGYSKNRVNDDVVITRL